MSNTKFRKIKENTHMTNSGYPQKSKMSYPNEPPSSQNNDLFSVISQMQFMKMESDMMQKMMKYYDHTDQYMLLAIVVFIGVILFAWVMGWQTKKKRKKSRGKKGKRVIDDDEEDEAESSDVELIGKSSSLHIVTAAEAEALLNHHNSTITISDEVRKSIPKAPVPPSDNLF